MANKLGRTPKGLIDENGRECSRCGIYKTWDNYARSFYTSTKKQPQCKDCMSCKDRPEYRAWMNMMTRCYVKNTEYYKYYGGRGIQVCQRWRTSFKNFFQDVGPKPNFPIQLLLDRIDNDGNYSCGKCEECLQNSWPFNVKWSTYVESANNRRPKGTC